MFQVMRQRIGNKTYFTHEIFGAEIKKINNASRVIEVANEILPYDEKIKILNLYDVLHIYDSAVSVTKPVSYKIAVFFKLFELCGYSVHAVLAYHRKPSCGIIPSLRQRKHCG